MAGGPLTLTQEDKSIIQIAVGIKLLILILYKLLSFSINMLSKKQQY